MPIRTKFSERQAGERVAVNVLALSPQARRSHIVLNVSPAAPLVVINSTQKLTFTSASTSGFKIIAVYVNFVAAPAVSGGTSTLGISRIAVDGSTATVIVTAATILAGYTARTPVVQTLAASNPTAITAGESVEVAIVTSNNTVGTADTGASVTFLVEAVEDAVINDTNATI